MYRPLLAGHLQINSDDVRRIDADYRRFAESGLPQDVEGYLTEAYRLDVSSRYAGFPIRNPFGKASGQLSLQTSQVQSDADSRLGFVVLKTVIAQDESGEQMMKAWAIKETRMTVQKIFSQRSGAEGWTVSWKGRGWFGTLEKYLELFAESLGIAARSGRTGVPGMLVVPSCKYHLPTPDEDFWKQGEYQYTTARLLDVWAEHGPAGQPMPIEKDFSPTLAGSDRAAQQAKILQWLRTVPQLVHDAAGDRPVRLGLKLFNALFDDEFQLRMLQTVHSNQPPGRRPDFLVYANRLFDPSWELTGKDSKEAGHQGIAFGGAELSERNMAVLDEFHKRVEGGWIDRPVLPISGTGDISSGRVALEYALRGCENFQIHTLFQLPNGEYAMKQGPKTARALHELYFNPVRGLVPWMLHLRRAYELFDADGITRLADVVVWKTGKPHPLAAR